MRIDWWTLALQAINFVVLAWLLWRFLYHPVRQVIEKRRALAEQAFTEAAAAKQAAEAARQGFEASRDELAEERRRLRKTLNDELAGERRAVLERARGEADGIVEAARRAIAEERAAALAELRGQIAETAAELAAGLLRQAGAGLPADAFLAELERRLEELPADERERLAKDLGADGAHLTVVTAEALAPDDAARWRARLGARLGQADAMRFVVDPAIVGGAELRFPHAVLRLAWAEQLSRAREELVRDGDAR